MVIEQDVQIMKTSYGLLYEVENSIRTYIKEKMKDYYGIHWFHVAPRKVLKSPPRKAFETLGFPDYETYFQNYPKAFNNLPPDFLRQLRQIYPLRNKIAHNHLLSQSEFQIFEQSVNFILHFMKSEFAAIS